MFNVRTGAVSLLNIRPYILSREIVTYAILSLRVRECNKIVNLARENGDRKTVFITARGCLG